MDNSNSTSTLNVPLTHQTIEVILKLHNSEASTEVISSALGLSPAVVIKAEKTRLEEEVKTNDQLKIRRPQEQTKNSNEVEDPEIIYSYQGGTRTVHWTKLSTGELHSAL